MSPQETAIILEAVGGLVLAVGVAGLLVLLGTAATRIASYMRQPGP